jgi:curli biogenesis system outer membrane secretion channel CsgG
MLATLVWIGMLAQASTGTVANDAKPSPVQVGVSPSAAHIMPSSAGQVEEDDSTVLLKIKRIYVDSFGDDITSKELQSMIVSALVESKRFKVTENRDHADAILKGVALEKTSQEMHGYGDSTAVGGAAGGHSSTINGSNGNVSGSSSGGFVARHLGISDSSVNTETIENARIAIRLISPDGDVIWTSTQESKGAKYKGASADVADKCVKQLVKDVEKLEAHSKGVSEPIAPANLIGAGSASKQ